MSVNIGIQLTDLQPDDNNLTQNINTRNPAEFYSSVASPTVVQPGDQIICKSAFLNLRNQNNGNIIVDEDTDLKFSFYHYYIPQLQDGIDTGTSGDNQYSGVDCPISSQGQPFILMVRKDYWEEYLQTALSNASPSNPPDPAPFKLFDKEDCYTQENYGTTWTLDDFVPVEFSYTVTLKGNSSYSPSYLAQYITTKINSQPNGTTNNNWKNQPPTFPDGQPPIQSIYYNPNYADNVEWPSQGDGFGFQWFGGTRSNNPFYASTVSELMNVEFYNAWYNDFLGNRKTFVYLWKNLYSDTYFHNSSFMFSGTTQASMEFSTNNSNLFSFNIHSPIYNNNQLSIWYRAYSEGYQPEPATINYGWLFTKQGGVMFSQLEPQSFWSQLGFDNTILATFDDPTGTYRMTNQLYNSITSDTYTTISQINANQTYLQSQKPIYNNPPDANDFNLYFQSSDFVEIFARNGYIANLDDVGHYLLELTAYPTKFSGNSTFQNIAMILPTYFSTPGFSTYVFCNQINSFPSSYTHFGEPFQLGYVHCRILKPNLQIAKIGRGNYIYLEVVKPLNNILKSIKNTKIDSEDERRENPQNETYAGQK